MTDEQWEEFEKNVVEDDTVMNWYLEKADKHKKLKYFFKVIPVPKRKMLFRFTTMCLFILIELFFTSLGIKTFFIPSLFGIFFIWRFQVVVNIAYQAAEDATVDHVCMEIDTEELLLNFPDDDPTLTEDEKYMVLDDCVDRNLNNSMIKDLKVHSKPLIDIVTNYSLFYILVAVIS